jgi:hypothetical protein
MQDAGNIAIANLNSIAIAMKILHFAQKIWGDDAIGIFTSKSIFYS